MVCLFVLFCFFQIQLSCLGTSPGSPGARVPSLMCRPVFSESLQLLVNTMPQPGMHTPLMLGAQTNTSVNTPSKLVGSLGARIFRLVLKIRVRVGTAVASLPSLSTATERFGCLLESRGPYCILIRADLALGFLLTLFCSAKHGQMCCAEQVPRH